MWIPAFAAAKGLPRCETSLCGVSKQPRVWQQLTGRKLIGSPQGSSFTPFLCRCVAVQPVPSPCCRLSERNHIALPCSPLPASPSQFFPLSLGRLKGREVQAQGLILPDAEHLLGHLKPASWKLWISCRGCSVGQATA